MHHQALQRQLAQQGGHTQQPQKSEQHHRTTYSVNSGSTLTFALQIFNIQGIGRNVTFPPIVRLQSARPSVIKQQCLITDSDTTYSDGDSGGDTSDN